MTAGGWPRGGEGQDARSNDKATCIASAVLCKQSDLLLITISSSSDCSHGLAEPSSITLPEAVNTKKDVGGDLIPEPVSADKVFAKMLRSYN